MMNRLFHRHSWVTWGWDVLAQYEKQDGQENKQTYLCEGQVCSDPKCPAERLVPNDKRLRPVELKRD